jgi:uncharacterized membrane protein YgdD (TMEM256/DUF423 family)
MSLPHPKVPGAAPAALPQRLLGASGPLLAACATALAAYAAHGAEGEVRAHLYMAALFAFGNGIGLAALAPRASRRLGLLALSALLAGTLVFAGSLVAAKVSGVPTMAAPWGGYLMIGGWLLLAADLLRR